MWVNIVVASKESGRHKDNIRDWAQAGKIRARRGNKWNQWEVWLPDVLAIKKRGKGSRAFSRVPKHIVNRTLEVFDQFLRGETWPTEEGRGWKRQDPWSWLRAGVPNGEHLDV